MMAVFGVATIVDPLLGGWITDLFLVAALAVVPGLVATLFRPEIPLRAGHQIAPAVGTVEDELACVGLEMAPDVRPEGPEQLAATAARCAG